MLWGRAQHITVCNLQITQNLPLALSLIKPLTDLGLPLRCDEKCAAGFTVVAPVIGHLIFPSPLGEQQ